MNGLPLACGLAVAAGEPVITSNVLEEPRQLCFNNQFQVLK